MTDFEDGDIVQVRVGERVVTIWLCLDQQPLLSRPLYTSSESTLLDENPQLNANRTPATKVKEEIEIVRLPTNLFSSLRRLLTLG